MDYRQTEGTANSWRRARQVTIENPRDRTPNITFHEEDIVAVGGQEFRTPVMGVGVVHGEFDSGAEIALINPETGEPLGVSVPQSQLYVILHSLYIQLAHERDAAQANPPALPDAPPSAPPADEPETP